MKCAAFLCLLVFPQLAAAASRRPTAQPEPACVASIDAAPRPAMMPVQMLHAISAVESGRIDPATHRAAPWPWTINVNGVGYFYESKAQVVAAVGLLQAAGIRSIDVGCMQVNLMYHPDAFASLDTAFDPATNVAYAIRFLSSLYHQTGSWPTAAAAYHSQTPEIGADYEKKVMAAWSGKPPPSVVAPAPVEVAEAPDPTGPTPELLQLHQQMQEDHAALLKAYGKVAPANPPVALAIAARPVPRRRRGATVLATAPTTTGALLLLADSRWLDGVIRR